MLFVAGLAFAWLGYWAPWIAHKAAALNFNGYEFAEWVSRLPGVRDGSLRLSRFDFLAPLAAISLLTAFGAELMASLPRWPRWGAKVLAFLGAFAILPEYPFILTAHTDPELRPALILGIFTLALILGSAFIGRVPKQGAPARRRRIVQMWAVACLALPALALGSMSRALVIVWPALAGLLNAAPHLNWGPGALALGCLLIALTGILTLSGQRATNQPANAKAGAALRHDSA